MTAPYGTVRYWASARAAVGQLEEQLAASTLGEVLELLTQRHSERPKFAQLLSICSYVVDGQPAGRRPPGEIVLADGWVVEVLPPFAGG